MNKIKKMIFKSNFVKNVIIVASGTAGAQIITMLFSVIITRMYGPEAFGVMGTFSAMVNIIAPIAALTYPIAIVLPKTHKEAKKILKLSLLISGILSIASLLVIIIFQDSIVSIFGLQEMSFYLYYIPFVIISAAIMQIMEQWSIRMKQFKVNAKAALYQSLIINVGKVGVGFFSPVAHVLVFFTTITNGVRGVLIYLFGKKPTQIVDNKDGDYSITLKQTAKKYYDFPIYRAPQDLLDSFQQSFPVILLTTFFGPASAGFYTLGRSVLRVPSSLIGKAVGDVFYPRVAEAVKNNEDTSKLILKGTWALAAVGIIPYGIVFLFGPQLFSFVFGSEWHIAGEYARWISLWSYFALLNRPSVRSVPVLNLQRFFLIYTFIWTVLKLALIVVSYYLFNSDIIAIALFCISGVISNIILIQVTLKKSTRKPR